MDYGALLRGLSAHEDGFDASVISPCVGTRTNWSTTDAQQPLWLSEDDDLAAFPHSTSHTTFLSGAGVFASYRTDCWRRKKQVRHLGVFSSM